MKGSLAWIIFGLAALGCLFWIGFGVRDDLREDDVFRNIIRKRIAISKSSDQDLHIGVVGDWKQHGDILRGVELAAGEINESNGILGRKVVLDVEDDKGTVDGALGAAQAFASRPEVAFVIGHTHLNLNLAVAQNYEFYKVFCISPNTASSYSSGSSFSLQFENGMPPSQTSGAILKLAKENGWKRLGLLYSKSEHAMRQARRFESMANKHDINIPLSFGYEGRGSGIARHMEHWKRELDLDAMIFAMDEEDIARLISACRVIGIDSPFIVVSEKTAMQKSVEKELGTIYFLEQPHDVPAVANLLKRCQKAFGHAPSAEMMQGFDALHILAQAIRKAKSFVPADVAASLKGLKVDSSVSGTLRFDEQGTAIKRPVNFTADRERVQGQ